MELNHYLQDALQANNIEYINEALNQGADVNTTFNQGFTFLHEAVDKGFIGVVELLSTKNDVRIDSTNDFGMTPLSSAISSGQDAMVKLLLAAGANPNRKTTFDQSPVHLAAFYENVSVLCILINNGAQVNTVDCFNQSPLCISILLKPNRKVTQMLLEAGADPNFKSKTTLSLLAEAISSVNVFKHEKVIKTLIDYGANVNETDEIKRETPLHKAAAVGCCSIIKYLLKNGADFHMRNVEGHTAYDIAKANYHDYVCQELVDIENREIDREFFRLRRLNSAQFH